MSAASAFHGYDFTAGSVRGLRVFRIDSLGRLTGYTYRKPWRPGENVAACHKGEAAAGNATLLHRPYYSPSTTTVMWHITPPPPAEPESEASKEEPHSLETCGCGFYAFYDGSNEYAEDGCTVSAVIDGYGKTVVGTRGFRCEKARIVALFLPSAPEAEHEATEPEPESRTNVSDLALTWILLIAAAASAGVSAVTAALPDALAAGVLTGSIATVAWSIWNLLDIAAARHLRGTACAYSSLHDRGRCREIKGRRANAAATASRQQRIVTYADTPQRPTEALLEKVRRNYPDVQVFDTYEAMVEAFPPDKAAEPTPQTDPDFWTRAVR